nr:membrane protein [Salmonella sp. NCTC 7297]
MISACTLLSGMVWALVIIHGSVLASHLEIVSYVLTGIVGIPDVYPGKAAIAFFCTGNIYWRLCDICRAG